MLLIRAGSHKMLVKITNREDPDQSASPDQSDLVKNQSDLGLCCLFCPFWQVTHIILEHLP